jgi:Bifunctional DNA primase/polymerase, N-terminal
MGKIFCMAPADVRRRIVRRAIAESVERWRAKSDRILAERAALELIKDREARAALMSREMRETRAVCAARLKAQEADRIRAMLDRPPRRVPRFDDWDWYLFPCDQDGRPLIEDWENASTKDNATIQGWKDRWPDSVPALPCGKNDLVVIECERDSISIWERMCFKNRINPERVPIIETPSGGRQYLFMSPRKWAIPATKNHPGIVAYGEGDFTMSPGAKLADGREWKIRSSTFALAAAAIVKASQSRSFRKFSDRLR